MKKTIPFMKETALDYVNKKHIRGEFEVAVACYESLLKLEPNNEKIKFYLETAKIGVKPTRHFFRK